MSKQIFAFLVVFACLLLIFSTGMKVDPKQTYLLYSSLNVTGVLLVGTIWFTFISVPFTYDKTVLLVQHCSSLFIYNGHF